MQTLVVVHIQQVQQASSQQLWISHRLIPHNVLVEPFLLLGFVVEFLVFPFELGVLLIVFL